MQVSDLEVVHGKIGRTFRALQTVALSHLQKLFEQRACYVRNILLFEPLFQESITDDKVADGAPFARLEPREETLLVEQVLLVLLLVDF